MYYINDNYKGKGNIEDVLEISGFPMGPSGKVYQIGDSNIKAISISSTKLANPFAWKIVSKKYQKLIEYLTTILIDDDDESGETMREALNQIEKFRQEIKNKYRDYLKRKELEMMAKQLQVVQKEIYERLELIRDNLIKSNEERRSK